MACSRVVEVGRTSRLPSSTTSWSHTCAEGGLPSQLRSSTQAQCLPDTRTVTSTDPGCSTRLTVVCKKAQGRRTGRSHLRSNANSLQSSEATDSGSHATTPVGNPQELDSSSAQSHHLTKALAQTGARSGTLPQTRSVDLSRAKSINLNALAALGSRRGVAAVCSEGASQQLPASTLPAAAGAAAVAVVGYFVVFLAVSLAQRMVSGLTKAGSKLQGQSANRGVLLAGVDQRPCASEDAPAAAQQQQRSTSAVYASNGSGASELLRSNRSSSLVPSSNLKKSKASKRVPLVVSAATPSAIYEQNTGEASWHKAEAVNGNSLHLGSQQLSMRNGGTAVVFSPAPESLGAAAGKRTWNEEDLLSQEIRLRAVLDADWVPTFHMSTAESLVAGGQQMAAQGKGTRKAEDEGRDETVALAASLAAQQMMQMERAQEEQIAAMRRAAALEGKVLREMHQKELAAVEAQLSAARNEASIASTIAKHLLESDAGDVVTIKAGHSASNGFLPWPKAAAPEAPGAPVEFEGEVLKFEDMSSQMRELVRSFNSVLEMKLSKESAHRQAVEERLREAVVEHRMLKGKLEKAMALSKHPLPVEEAQPQASAEVNSASNVTSHPAC